MKKKNYVDVILLFICAIAFSQKKHLCIFVTFNKMPIFTFSTKMQDKTNTTQLLQSKNFVARFFIVYLYGFIVTVQL